jgi:hypothetical protein
MAGLPAGKWDSGRWGQSSWYQPVPPSTAGWGADWRWWLQTGSAVTELAGLVVEARWTTDAHTAGDGTFRGDLQPGKLTLRLWDPGHALDDIDLMAVVFAHYRPAGLSFVWFVDSLTRGLYAPGDPADADTVISGLGWPARLTVGTTTAMQLGQQSAATRLTTVADTLNTNHAQMILPPVAADIAGQSQLVAPTAADATTGLYPSYLQACRDAATFGVCWLQATGGAADGSTGALTLVYRRWETVNIRPLDASQVVAGPPVSRAMGWVLTQTQTQPLDYHTAGGGSLPVVYGASSSTDIYGIVSIGPMRVWDLVNGSGPAYLPIISTMSQLLADHSQSDSKYLSTVSLQSGARWTKAGRPSTNAWDPTAHVFAPDDVADYVDPATAAHQRYRVVQSDHTLNAKVWQTTHTLEAYTAATALPA